MPTLFHPLTGYISCRLERAFRARSLVFQLLSNSHYSMYCKFSFFFEGWEKKSWNCQECRLFARGDWWNLRPFRPSLCKNVVFVFLFVVCRSIWRVARPVMRGGGQMGSGGIYPPEVPWRGYPFRVLFDEIDRVENCFNLTVVCTGRSCDGDESRAVYLAFIVQQHLRTAVLLSKKVTCP